MTANLIFAAVWPLLSGCLAMAGNRHLKLSRPRAFAAGQGIAGGVMLIAYVSGDLWLPSAICAAHLAVALAVSFWLRRRDRKRAASLIGAKTRLLIAAMVAAMRDRAVLRPGTVPS